MSSSAADYVVVGGGLAGCVIASCLSLSESKPEVILIEAGPDPAGKPNTETYLNGLSLLGGELDYAYQSEPVETTENRVHTLNAGKTLGGGSILNFGGWLRADAQDYDQWSEVVGDKRWSHEGLKPWLEKVESKFNVSAISGDENRKYPLRDAVNTAWKELGVGTADRAQGSIRGIVEMLENSRDGVRQPSNAAYSLERVKVLTNCTVHRVLFSGTAATGVVLADGTKFEAKREVILCAGTYRTPQILMLSGVGPNDVLSKHGIELVHDSPSVGQNLSDHFAIYLAFRLRDPARGLALGSPSWQNPALFKGLPYDWSISDAMPSALLAKHKGASEYEDRNLFEVLTVYVPPGIPGIPVDGTHIATSTMLLLPNSRGTISLHSSSPTEPPKICPNYLSSDLDREVLTYATRRTLQALLGTKGLGEHIEGETPPSWEGLGDLVPLTLESSDDVILDRILRTGMQHHHSAGTCAMGNVVDAVGRVRGLSGLRVADASVIPVPLGGHPQATLYAVAEQLASLIIHGEK